jgi:hypothetical protein
MSLFVQIQKEPREAIYLYSCLSHPYLTSFRKFVKPPQFRGAESLI